MAKKKALFIVNPISGSNRSRSLESLIEKYLDHSLYQWDVHYTRAPKEATTISRRAADRVEVVVAVGGDGSVNEVCRGLLGSRSALGIVPTGSGNGLARYLHIPSRLPDAIRTLNQCRIKKIDTVSINEDIFVNVAGVGFDAHVAHVFSSFGERGFFAYVKSILTELLDYKEREYRFFLDNTCVQEKAFLVTFANSSQYGNNAHISPQAKIDDGLLEVCILKKFPLCAVPFLAFRLFTRTIDRSRYYTSFSCREVVLEQGENMEVHIDGEPCPPVPRLELKVKPQSLKVITGKVS